MHDLSGYVPYRIAKQSLDARLKTTEAEIALWVSGVGGSLLDAYMIGFSGVIPFCANGSNPFGGEDYISPLEYLYFLPDDIEKFQPDKRFISFDELVERWKKYNSGDSSKTRNLIDSKRVSENLIEYHPVYGVAETVTGENFERGLFDLEVVERIESCPSSLGVPVLQTELETEATRTKDIQANNNDMGFSGLLKTPSKTDDWFQVIDDMTRDFYHEHETLPNEAQAWCHLLASQPLGYKITTIVDKYGKQTLNMSGKKLTNKSFKDRWKRYQIKSE